MAKKDIVKVLRILMKKTMKMPLPSVSQIQEELDDPFKVLVSCIMSLRTKDETTYPTSVKLFKEADTAKKIASMPLAKLKKIIRPVNYYKTKAERIKKISQQIVKDYGGKVPEDFDELMKFKGVGRKTANLVISEGFGKPALCIDTHCHRIPQRLGWFTSKSPYETEFKLMKMLPKKYWKTFNPVFVRFGQNICRPIKPHCWECPITKYCKYYKTKYLHSIKKVRH